VHLFVAGSKVILYAAQTKLYGQLSMCTNLRTEQCHHVMKLILGIVID